MILMIMIHISQKIFSLLFLWRPLASSGIFEEDKSQQLEWETKMLFIINGKHRFPAPAVEHSRGTHIPFNLLLLSLSLSRALSVFHHPPLPFTLF